jgi:hypothetical protein
MSEYIPLSIEYSRFGISSSPFSNNATFQAGGKEGYCA